MQNIITTDEMTYFYNFIDNYYVFFFFASFPSHSTTTMIWSMKIDLLNFQVMKLDSRLYNITEFFICYDFRHCGTIT